MANVAVFPSANAPTTITVNGRTYTCAIGATPIVVPDWDAFVLTANGWLRAAGDGAGTTAQRPAAAPGGASPPRVGFEYYDSTVGANVIWNGKNWINHATGANA
jgi:hypothetical protein